MRWVVTGSGGQLGQCLVAAVEAAPGEELVAAFPHEALDVSDPAAVDSLFERVPGGADVLVNAAGFTAVDRCETDAGRAFAVNALAPGRLAEACRAAGAGLVHVSTDYVFDGLGSSPYGEEDGIAPQSEYGRGKAEGERRVLSALPEALVVRTGWLFGPGRNFVVAILEQAAKRHSGETAGPLRVVDDQRGTPTYAADLAEGLLALGRRMRLGSEAGAQAGEGQAARGVVHLANAGETTWFEFARAILDDAGHGELAVEPISTAELGLPAPRPAYSVLDCSRAARLGVTLRSWREALGAYLTTLSPRSLAGVAS